LDKKDYTILIVPPEAIKVKGITLPYFLPKILIALLGIAIVIFSFILYDFMVLRIKFVELKKLRADICFQKTEIVNVAEKIALMEDQANKLQDLGKGVKKDLKEVEELRTKMRVSPLAVLKRAQLVTERKASFREDQVSVLEKERTALVSQLHQKLLELRKQAFQREHHITEIQKFLQVRKSILLTIPSLWPVSGRITSGFGEIRQVVSSGGTRPHMGLDIAAPCGTPILAPANGVVSFAGREATYGHLICIDHGHGFLTRYGHLQELLVKTGAKVKRGQIIGKVGVTGKTNGPHLHYVVCLHGCAVNPGSYLTQRLQ
jgi:murein DD-endopeptidase MepM/ murein hydrolase activator NlpD